MASSMQDHGKAYAMGMRKHPYGYAVYKPLPNGILNPGACGYFDDSGTWNPIASLNDEASLAKYGLRAPDEELDMAPTDSSARWGPKWSMDVREEKVDVSAGITDTGLPMEASLQFKYRSVEGQGAVLVTTAPIHHDYYYYESPFKEWFGDNLGALLRSRRAPEIETHGLFVITQTYSTRSCALTSSVSPYKEIFLGFSAGPLASAGLDLGTHRGWFVRSNDGWNHHDAPNGARMVVFIGGIWFKIQRKLFGYITSTSAQPIAARQGESRSSAGRLEAIQVRTGENEGYEVLCETFGTTPGPHDDDDD